MIKLKGPILSILILLVTFTTSFGQASLEKFGKNRLQYKSFKWRYYSTDNFDIYFYDNGIENANLAAEFLEKEFDRLTDLVGYSPYTKTKIFLYNSKSDLQQSNIGLNEQGFTVAGKTDFVKAQVEIAYTGQLNEFKEELISQVTSMLLNDMLFGGSLTDMFQSSYLMALPEWFVSGAARYLALGWDVEMDDFMRDALRKGRIKKLNKFTDEEAALLGQSIWNFIAEKYGKAYISNILNLTRIIRNEERSISGTLGLPFRMFLAEWNAYYMEQAEFVNQEYTDPDKKLILETSKKSGEQIGQLRLSPDGARIAYVNNNKGRYKVLVRRVDKKREKVVMRGGYKVINQRVNDDYPILSWQNDNTLGIIGNKYGKLNIWLASVSGRKKVKKELMQFNIVKDFDIVNDGNLAVLSADRNGMNDLYLLSLKRNTIKRLTYDIYDDVQPRFIPGTSSIIFSSNRPTDSISTNSKNADNIGEAFNLFIYNIDTTKEMAYRVTNTLSDDLHAIPYDNNTIFYVSDLKGISNVFKFNLKTNVYNQTSNLSKSIEEFDLIPGQGTAAYLMNFEGRQHIFVDRNFDLEQNIFTTQTKRVQFMNAKFVAKRLQESGRLLQQQQTNIVKEGSVSDTTQIAGKGSLSKQKTFLDNYDVAPEDSSTYINTSEFIFSDDVVTDQDFTDTDNYVFDTDVVNEAAPTTNSFLSTYRKLKKKSDVVGPLPYEPRFSADNVVTSFVIDPILGFGINLEAQMNDELENNRVFAGALINTDLRNRGNGYVYGEYHYLKHTVDFKAKYYRKAYSLIGEGSISPHKYTLNRFELGASLPLSVSSRLSITPFYTITKFNNLDYQAVAISPPNVVSHSTNNYAGFKAEFVFDNSTISGLNLIHGTRGKVMYEYHEGLNNPQNSFGKFALDFRNYQKLHREIVFATRLYYGRFMGKNKQSYILGGMDNWLFSKTDNHRAVHPLVIDPKIDNSNILFAEYVTSLRGFNYNTMYGNNSILFNAELRFPVVKYFYRGPIANNFLRNLQLIGFYDVGSSWSGETFLPTSDDVNTEIIETRDNNTSGVNSPFRIKLNNFNNPWLMSYGVGVRTVLLGYFVKVDMAYPYRNFVSHPTRWHVTLGYDF